VLFRLAPQGGPAIRHSEEGNRAPRRSQNQKKGKGSGQFAFGERANLRVCSGWGEDRGRLSFSFVCERQRRMGGRGNRGGKRAVIIMNNTSGVTPSSSHGGGGGGV